MRGISCVVEDLLPPQKGLCSVELVGISSVNAREDVSWK